MRTKVICSNDFPTLAFPPGTPDEVIEKERKRLQQTANEKFPDHRVYIHVQNADWYEGGER